MEKQPSPLSPAERIATYERMCGGVPDGIYLLARSVVSDEDGILRPGSYKDIDLHGAPGGSMERVMAAVELQKTFPNAVVMTTSTGLRGSGAHAEVAARELVELGVPTDKILQQPDSYDTHTELLELIKAIVKYQWKRVVVMTNDYQVFRPVAMKELLHRLDDPNGYRHRPEVVEALDAFKKMNDVEIRFIRAETVLLQKGGGHARHVRAARTDTAYRAAIVSDIKTSRVVKGEDGTYWNRDLLPEDKEEK